MLNKSREKLVCLFFSHLSGDAQWLEGVGPARHDLGLVHQQNSDVVLAFNLQTVQFKH